MSCSFLLNSSLKVPFGKQLAAKDTASTPEWNSISFIHIQKVIGWRFSFGKLLLDSSTQKLIIMQCKIYITNSKYTATGNSKYMYIHVYNYTREQHNTYIDIQCCNEVKRSR